MKRRVKFDLFPKKVNGILVDCRPIRMRISYGGNRVDIRVGFSIEPEKWNAKEGRVITGAKNKYKQSSGEINKAIIRCEEIVDEVFTRFDLLEKRIPTEVELKKGFDEIAGRAVPEPEQPGKKFYEAYAEFMETKGRQNNWTKATYTKFNSLKKHLLKYDSNLTFELTEKILMEFVISLQLKELRNTTIAKYVSFLRWFLRWASSADYYKGKLHETFRPKFKGTDGNSKEVIYLEWEELIKLYSFNFPASKPSLPAVRDVFCFCCFTGLRYSDVAKLKKTDIIKNQFIRVVTQKTVDGLRIELNKYSRAILKKYESIGLPNGKALPVISNDKMNEHLKEIGELAGFDTPERIVYFIGNERHELVLPKYALLTTHCGRRTFIVNGLRLGVPAEVIMKWTGHSDYKAMKPYIKIVDQLKATEMEKFDNFRVQEKKQNEPKKKKNPKKNPN